jgi:mercuric ion binding protein
LKKLSLVALFVGTLGVASLALAAGQTVTLDVPGMNCPTCPLTVKKALMKVSGVQEVKVNFDKREAVVTFDDTQANVEKLRLATENAGYPSTPKKLP